MFYICNKSNEKTKSKLDHLTPYPVCGSSNCFFLLRANFKIWSTIPQAELNNVFISPFLQTKQHIECPVAVKRGVVVAEDPPLILWIHQLLHVPEPKTNKESRRLFSLFIYDLSEFKGLKKCVEEVNFTLILNWYVWHIYYVILTNPRWTTAGPAQFMSSRDFLIISPAGIGHALLPNFRHWRFSKLLEHSGDISTNSDYIMHRY